MQVCKVPEWFEDQTEMLFMVKVSEETQTVKFIIWICVVQLLQKLKLLQSRFLPVMRQEKQKH